jgi:hypothetical protein
MVWNLAIKQLELIYENMKNLSDFKYATVSDVIYDSLEAQYGDYRWEVHFMLGATEDSCNVLGSNCISISIPQTYCQTAPPPPPVTTAAPPDTTAAAAPPATDTTAAPPPPTTAAPPPVEDCGTKSNKIIVAWSPKCNMAPHVNKAKEALDKTIKNSAHLFGPIGENKAAAMLAFLMDPQGYVRSENLSSTADFNATEVGNLTFYENNVAVILAPDAKFYSKIDGQSYKYESDTKRILTKRSLISEHAQADLFNHRVMISYYSSYNRAVTDEEASCD